MDSTATKEYLTVRQVSREIGVSGTAIREKVKKGELPGIKSGNKWIIKKEDFDAFYKNNPKLTRIHTYLDTHKNHLFFTIPDIMKLFNIAYITAYRWVHYYHYLVTITISHRLYVPEASIREFIHHNPEKVIFHCCPRIKAKKSEKK